MNTFLTKIKNYWFIKVSPTRLAILRIATGLFSLWYLISRFDMIQRMTRNIDSFDPIGLLKWMTYPLSSEIFWWISIGIVILNIFYIIGWKFKFTGPAFAIAALLFFTYRNSWSMIYHNRNALILHIVILGFVASADALSWDSWKRIKKSKSPSLKAHWQYGWPIQLICAATVGSYLLAGIAKLSGGMAWEWANGTAMRAQIAVDAIRKEMLGSETAPLFDFLFEHIWLFLAMGILTFVLELGAPLALVKKRWGIVWAILTWTMHWGIFFIMGISFRYQMTGLLFLSFFDIEKLWTPNKKVQSTIYTTDLIIEKNHKPIIFFDGICNLCNTWIQFILKKEKYPYFKFASLQSEMAKVILKDHKISKDITTIVLIKDEKIYHKSDAILHICKHLNYPWYLGKWFLIVPKSLRDFVYNIIAKNRYKWFGKQKQCALMTSDQKLRFLDL